MISAATFVPAVIEQHAAEAAFHWLIRNAAVEAPHYYLIDLGRVDSRVDAHMDGLRVAADAGWDISKEALSLKEAGEIFAAAVLAFESREDDRIQTVLELGSSSVELSSAIVSALGWLSYVQAEEHITGLLTASSHFLHRVGIAASAIHRKDPGESLIHALGDDDLLLRARALRAVGELGRTDLLSSVQKNLTSKDHNCRVSAAWSAALLHDLDSVSILQSFVGLDVPYGEEAVTLALRQMELATASRWQKELAENPELVRLAVIGAGALGSPTTIPWLIEKMRVPELARVAGESLTMMTGVDIAYEDLEGDRPEGFESGPTEDPKDENIEMDPDEDLPWPNPELIQKWWNNYRGNFQNGARYLIGKPITEEWLHQVLRIGRQRQRAAAALELVLRRPGQPLFEVRAPGFRQQQILGLKVTR
jgi:uncharacterized protein (TIGR02270 family)